MVSILLLCGAIGVFGQNETLTLGFCHGESATRSGIELNGKGWTEAAIKLSEGSLSAYKNAEITAVRAALVNRVNVDTLRVWVRDDLDGRNLAEGTITRKSEPAVAKGWNEVQLNAPFEITGDKPLYIGYSLHQKANVQAVSVVGEGILDTSFYRFNDESWNDISDKGVLSIEALLSGSAIAHYDLGVVNAQVFPYTALSPNAVMVKATVANFGLETVDGWTMGCYADGAGGTCHIGKSLASNSFENVSFVMDPGIEVAPDAVWTVSITGIDGHEDEKAGNNSVNAICTYRKNVLIEEFTTEQCSNCPGMATRLHIMLDERKDRADVINVVCHHAGFGIDSFTKECDNEFLWFYNNGGRLYAPAIMVDRSTDFSGKNNTPVFLPQNDELGAATDAALDRTANCMVSLAFDYDENSGRLQVAAGCTKNDKFDGRNPALTLYLTEDDVNAVSQEGSTGLYRHQHLIRDYSSVWGVPVDWEGDTFSFGWETMVNPEWKFKDLKLVGVLAAYNPEDPTDCRVWNSASVSLDEEPPVPGAVKDVDVNDRRVAAIYDLSGNVVAEPSSGFYIVRYEDGTSQKIFRK